MPIVSQIPKAVGQEFVNAGPSGVEGLTGLPKKVRRGRHAKTKANAKPSPAEHHAKLNAAMQAGDHASAKSHALALVNALHRAQPAAPSPTHALA